MGCSDWPTKRSFTWRAYSDEQLEVLRDDLKYDGHAREVERVERELRWRHDGPNE
jgi:hypothetical protein